MVGAADGSIMPIIMTAHIANRSARWNPSQTGVIIHADGPFIGPYMSRAIGTIHVHASAVAPAKPAATNSRSRSSARSSTVRPRVVRWRGFAAGPEGLSDDAVGAPVEAGKVRVGLREIDLDRTRGFRRAGRVFGFRVFDSHRQHDSH